LPRRSAADVLVATVLADMVSFLSIGPSNIGI
jgi:hypothetical protein